MDRDQEERKIKREMMATAAMMGLLAANVTHSNKVARDAVALADALLAELEKEKETKDGG